MSDKKKPYTNLDLETAERLLIAAGSPDQAEALHYHTQGIRNFIQGEFGQSFVDAFDRVVEKHIGPLAEGINGLRTDVQQSAAEFSARLKKHDDEIAALTAVVAEHKEDHDTRITSLEDYRAEMLAFREALAALSARIDSALPTEKDQALSTELRGGAAEQSGDDTGSG